MPDGIVGRMRGWVWMLGLACAALAHPVAGQESGRLTGRALQEPSGEPLVGAAVVVEGTSLGTVTDVQGRYLLPWIPMGEHTVRVTFLGYETRSGRVTVAPGATATLDFSVPVAPIALEGVTVLGARAMVQAEALNRQKNAPNIVNIVASDQMGRFPDASAPEAVQRIPGVAVARDMGEGRYIQIRGAAAANTQVTFNGVQMPSPEGEVRQIALDAVPVDILQSIEVSKALLPDMDADAVGGNVNLVTRAIPGGRVFSAEAAGGFAPIRDEPAGSASVTWGNRSRGGRFGYLLNGSWSRRSFGADDLEPSYDLGDAGLADDVLEELEVRHYSLWRERAGGTAAFQLQPSDGTTFGLTGIFTNLTDTEQRRRLNSIVEDGELEWQHKNREENLRTWSVVGTGEHLLGRSTLNYRLGWTRSLEDTPFDTEIAWIAEDVAFAPDIRDPDGVRSNPSTIGGEFRFDAIEPGSSDTEDTDRMGSLDLTVPFGLGEGSARLKLGVRVRDKTKTQSLVEEAYELADGDLVLGRDYGEEWGRVIRYPGEYALPAFGTSPGQVTSFVDRFRSRLEHEVDIESQTENYELAERVVGTYVMAELRPTASFMLLPGVRFEHTRVETDGFEFDADAETIAPVSAEKSWGEIFPMVHARWAVDPNTNVRGAFTTSLQRPNFYDLVPYRVRDGEDLALGNPDLEPMIARGLDLLLERYDRRIGVVSGGLFQKWLSDPIFAFVEENDEGGETEQPRNGESGWIRGAELALQRPLGGGFGLYGNYTFTDSEAELPGGRTVRLQGQARHVVNAALSFERSGLSTQVSLNYHGDYALEYGEEAFEDVFVAPHLQFDASAAYQVTPRARLFLELVNLTNEPYEAYQGVEERPVQQEYYEPWGRFGLRMAW